MPHQRDVERGQHEPSSSHVSDKVRRKIVEGEYIKINKLLPTLDDEEDEKREHKYKLTFYQWVKCYRIFMSIRVKAYPNEIQGLLRHGETVQDLHEQGRDCVLYDAKFRRFKEQHPDTKWGQYLPQVVDSLTKLQPDRSIPLQFQNQYRGLGNQQSRYHRGMASHNTTAFPPPPPPPTLPSPALPSPVCFFFNSQQGCSKVSCTFQHRCRGCGGYGHPVWRCRGRPNFQKKQYYNAPNN